MTVGRRSQMLHGANGGEWFVRWLLACLLGVLLILATYGTFYFVAAALRQNWSQGLLLTHVLLPLAMWITACYFTVVRFLTYLDARIRQEGWEVELRLRAGGNQIGEQTDSEPWPDTSDAGVDGPEGRAVREKRIRRRNRGIWPTRRRYVTVPLCDPHSLLLVALAGRRDPRRRFASDTPAADTGIEAGRQALSGHARFPGTTRNRMRSAASMSSRPGTPPSIAAPNGKRIQRRPKARPSEPTGAGCGPWSKRSCGWDCSPCWAR